MNAMRRGQEPMRGRRSRLVWLLLVTCGVSLLLNWLQWSRLPKEPPSEPPGEFVAYRPVFFDSTGGASVEDSYHVDRRAMSSAHIEKVSVVMDRLDLEYRYEGDQLLVPRSTWDDASLMRTITESAMNWYWLKYYADYEGDRRGTVEGIAAKLIQEEMERALPSTGPLQHTP